jgi:hypothetical protein
VIREALRTGATSRARLTNEFRRSLRPDFALHSVHADAAVGVAIGCVKGYRRRLRDQQRGRLPYVRRLYLRTFASAARLDVETGVLYLAVRAGERYPIPLVWSNWHRSQLTTGFMPKSVYIDEPTARITGDVPSPTPYAPHAAMALDTNETSLDGWSGPSSSASRSKR